MRPRTWLVAGVLALAGCAPEGGEVPAQGAGSPALVVYSGRSERLVGPLLERFQAESGVAVKVRYGETAELAATLLEEGERTPADVFLSQDAAALGALSSAGRLRPLPEELLARVPRRFASPRGDWVGESGRARAVVYNPERVTDAELPRSLEETAAPRYRGRFGVAPANASFQAHMAAYAAVQGTDALARLLDGMAANQPRRYANNMAIVEAVVRGEIDWGLVNHYYLLRALAEDAGAPGKLYFFAAGEASNLVNVAGIGLLRDGLAARRLVDFLLSPWAQEYLARETLEYPLVAGVAPPPNLVPLAELASPDVGFEKIAEMLPESLELIRASGLLQ